MVGMNDVATATLPETGAQAQPTRPNDMEPLSGAAEFFAILSHELRTPLAAIKGYSQGLLLHWDQLPATKHQHYVEAILRSTLRLERLVHDLSFAAWLADGLPMEIGPADLSAVVSQVLEEARTVHAPRQFLTLTQSDPLIVLADRQRVAQVLLNLLDNAAKYAPAGSPIVLTWSLDGVVARVEVRDDGLALSQDEQVCLFRRFGQLQPRRGTSAAAQGSGLGLSICKELVEAMGGAIGIEAGLSGGNTFWFTLPIP